MSDAPAGQRVDVWLWHARLFKTRSLATRVVGGGQVRLTSAGATRRLTRASALVRAGDTLTLPLNRRIVSLEILGLGARRGPAAEARLLYRLIEDRASGDE
ncbi:RNA-binding S4 domain-containing protein [Maricaulis sp.]|uniref:RNA-binding S4 domain-containing protein n=1 Tax=Maricaulis sp. TaxID=1486257 RepID=UPI00262DC9B9|nr:RNA-binding S4 domain-containing protein [Maricaulis sp.]